MGTSNSESLNSMLEVLGRELRAERVRKGWSRGDLALRAGISEKQVGNIERGDRGQLSEAWALAQAMGVEFGPLVANAERAVS